MLVPRIHILEAGFPMLQWWKVGPNGMNLGHGGGGGDALIKINGLIPGVG